MPVLNVDSIMLPLFDNRLHVKIYEYFNVFWANHIFLVFYFLPTSVEFIKFLIDSVDEVFYIIFFSEDCVAMITLFLEV